MRTLISRFVQYRLRCLDCTFQDTYLVCRHENLQTMVLAWSAFWLCATVLLLCAFGFWRMDPVGFVTPVGVVSLGPILAARYITETTDCFVSPNRLRHYFIHLLCWPVMPIVRSVDFLIAQYSYNPKRWPTSQYCDGSCS